MATAGGAEAFHISQCLPFQCWQSSTSIGSSTPHTRLDLERPICTFLFPLHCAAQCADVTGRVQRMSPVTDDQHLRSRAWNCLSRKLLFPATASALSRNWTTWRRRKKKTLMMMIAFKETLFLSRFVTIKEVVTVFKKHVFYPSKRATQT